MAVLCTHRQGAGADPPLLKTCNRGIHRTWRRLLNRATPRLTLGQISSFAWDRFLRRGVRNPGRSSPISASANAAGDRRALAEAQDLKLGRPTWSTPNPQAQSLKIRSSEGLPVQLAKPIPSPHHRHHPAGRGLEVHNADCPAIQRLRGERSRWVRRQTRRRTAFRRLDPGPHPRCAWRAGKGRQRHRRTRQHPAGPHGRRQVPYSSLQFCSR